METKDLVLYAWIGENGSIELKRALVDGHEPLVALDSGKLLKPGLVRQLQQQARKSAKPVRLVRFKGVEVIHEIKP